MMSFRYHKYTLPSILLAFALLGTLLLVACGNQLGSPAGTCQPDNPQHPHWQMLQQQTLDACMQVAWGDNAPARATTIRVQYRDGQLFGQNPSTKQWDRAPELPLPASSRGQRFRYRVMFMHPDFTKEQKDALCLGQMRAVNYDCLASPNPQKSGCLFVYEFHPSSSAKTFPIDGAKQQASCLFRMRQLTKEAPPTETPELTQETSSEPSEPSSEPIQESPDANEPMTPDTAAQDVPREQTPDQRIPPPLTCQNPVERKGRGGSLSCLSWSPNGSIFASCEDKIIRLWDARQTPTELRTQTGHSGKLLGIVFQSDSKRMFTVDTDKTIYGWDVAQNKPPFLKQQNPNEAYIAITADPSGTLIGTTSDQGSITIWDPGTGKTIANYTLTETKALSIAISTDRSLIAVGGEDGHIRVLNFQNNQLSLRSTLKGHSDKVTALHFRPKTKTFASLSPDGTLLLWDAENAKQLKAITSQAISDKEPKSLQFRPDGQYLAVGYDGGSVQIWDAVAFQNELSLKMKGGAVSGIAWSPDGKRLAGGTDSNRIQIWNCIP